MKRWIPEAGPLYAGKWNQTSAVGAGAGAANLTWIKLGYATDAEILALTSLKFSDIFETASAATAGFTRIKTNNNSNTAGNPVEWL